MKRYIPYRFGSVSHQRGSGVLETHLPENGHTIYNTYLVDVTHLKNLVDVTLTELTGILGSFVGKKKHVSKNNARI